MEPRAHETPPASGIVDREPGWQSGPANGPSATPLKPLAGLLRRPPLVTLVLAFVCGGIAAATVGLAVGFGSSEDEVVGQVRMWGALLTGLAAGLIGRGVWGWVAASAGATLGSAPFFPGIDGELSMALGLIPFTAAVLAPGYVIGRVVVVLAEGRSARRRVRREGLGARPGSVAGSTGSESTALWEPTALPAASGSVPGSAPNATAIVPGLAAALAGVTVGLLWVVLATSATDDSGAIALLVFSIGAGAIAGLSCGLPDRPGLLLAWVGAAVTSGVVALWMTDPAMGEEGAGYAMIALVMLLVVPAGGGFGLAWIIRRFRVGRPPWGVLATLGIIALVAIVPNGLLSGPASDFVWLAVILVGGLVAMLLRLRRGGSRRT